MYLALQPLLLFSMQEYYGNPIASYSYPNVTTQTPQEDNMQYSDMRNFGYTNKLFSEGPDSDEFLKTIEKVLPPVVCRAEAARITGGLISPKTLSNEGPLEEAPRHGCVSAPKSVTHGRPSWGI